MPAQPHRPGASWWYSIPWLAVAILLASCTGSVAGPDAAGEMGGPSPDSGEIADTGAPPPDFDLAQRAKTFQQLSSYAVDRMGQDKVPGAAIAVVFLGSKPMLKALGVKRRGATAPVTVRTLFSLASVSKMFTAATAMALADKKLLSPQDAVIKHLPKLKTSAPAQGAKMTLHQTLCHTSGLGYASYSAINGASLNWSSPQLLVEIFEKVSWPMWSPPGRVHNYSNIGFSLAGAVVQRAAGEPFATVVKKRLLLPAGMKDSTLSWTELKSRDHATGHTQTTLVAPDTVGAAYDAPNNGVYSSAADLAALMEMLLAGGKGVLSKGAVDALFKAQVSLPEVTTLYDYGYGFFRSRRSGVTVVDHAGSNAGFTADLALVPSRGFGVAVVMNAAHGNPWYVTDRALELFQKLKCFDGTWTPRTTQELQTLTGTYDDPFELGKISVTLAGGKLSATFNTWGHTATLTQQGNWAFVMPVSGVMSQKLWGVSSLRMVFYRDKTPRGEYLVTRLGVGKRDGP